MKHILLTLALLTITLKGASAAIMQTGDVAQLQFNGLPILYEWPFDGIDFGDFKMVANTTTSYTLLVEFFPDTLHSTPMLSFTLKDQPWTYNNFDQSIWQDLQGSVQLTVLSGVYDFNYMEIDIVINNIDYKQQFTDAEFQYVPIPPSLYLFLSGIVGIVSFRTKIHNNTINSDRKKRVALS